jgi:PAS domain S-box-containing protein
MKLRTLFLLGYLLLGIIAVILSSTAVYFIEKLSNTPDKILNDNYSSIIAAQNMIDELDNMDNAVIIYVAGGKEKSAAENLFSKAKEKYFENLVICEGNITEPGENDLLKIIRESTEDYTNEFATGKHHLLAINDYDSLVFPKYDNLKRKCYELLNLNHKGMTLRRDEAVRISKNAEIYMIIISIISLIVVIIAVIKVPSLVVNPILEFTRKVRAISDKKYSERVGISSQNELGTLAASFNIMAGKLQEYEQSNVEKLIAEKKRAEAIVKSMIDGIIVLNEENEVILVNTIGEELLGISEENVAGKNIYEISKYNNLLRNLLDDFKNIGNKNKLNYIRIVFREKEAFFLKEIIKVIDENYKNKILGYIIILKNVTGFKELDELKSGFVATVSHELRTPLSAMNMSLRLLQDERIGTMNDEQKRITSAMKDEVKRLLKLVNELLNLSKIESGGDILKYKKVKVEDIIDAAVTPMLMQFEQKNIKLNTNIEDDLPELNADANKISWVLINLLNNAIRYSKENSKIDLEVKKEKNNVLFSVKDYGTGIEPQYVGKIFSKFVQIKSGNIESNKGFGLGLAISKEFVNAHRGNIWVRSELGKGSEFFFTIPIN